MNLLFPNGSERVRELSADTYRHLAVEELTGMIAATEEEKAIVRKVFMSMPLDPDISEYRREILTDLLQDEELCDDLNKVLSQLAILKEFKDNDGFTLRKKSSLWDMINYMNEMEVYTRIIDDLNATFAKHTVTSKGLTEIADLLKQVIDEDRVAELKELIDSLRTDMSTLKSVTVGINLNSDLYPADIVIKSFNKEQFAANTNKIAWGISIGAQRVIRYNNPTPFMKHICEDMERELSRSVRTRKTELKQYINLKGYFLLDICDDLRFYLCVAAFARKLKKEQYSICMPVIKTEAKSVKMQGIYNLRLTANQTKDIVKNDFLFHEKEQMFILTGPNRGGKTMLTQAIGINALMAAQGLFVAADAYEGYLFDNILTHFPADENETLAYGRLGEEAIRVQQIVKTATSRTLVLLNETYSSTSAYDGLYMATDLVHILKHKNVPMIFNTHIHELATRIPEMNRWDGTSDVVSITMEIVNNVNTFRVLRKEPDNNSYARNIAEKYGVTYEQMLE